MQVFSQNNKTVVTINGKTRTYNGNISIINGKIISENESIDIAELSTEKQITVNITGDLKEISGVFSVNVNGKVEGNIYLKPGEQVTEFGRMIALKRAEEAKNYMVSQGVEAERIVPVANVGENTSAMNKSEEEKMYDRNCILSIYTGGK